MEFRQIQYFIKLSESTSISQAAKELFISQQALSKSIKNLESELNTRLFLRTNQGIKLSKSGVYLKNKFLSVCAGYEEAVKESYQYFQIQQGTITIGVAPGVFRSLSANYLINFEKLYPGLKLEQVEFPDLDMEESEDIDEDYILWETSSALALSGYMTGDYNITRCIAKKCSLLRTRNTLWPDKRRYM